MEQNIICCCGPKTWTKVIGWLGIVLPVYYAFQFCFGIDQFINMLYAIGVNKLFRAETDYLSRNRTEVCVSVLTSGVFSVVVHAMLLMGNEKKRPGLLRLWLILSWIEMVLVGILALICLFGGLLGSGLILLISLVVQAIFLYAVHKRYAEIKEATEPRIPVPMHTV